MRLRHIEIFQALLQAGTLTGAAQLLNVSQPAATKLLQQAERELGFTLFVISFLVLALARWLVRTPNRPRGGRRALRVAETFPFAAPCRLHLPCVRSVLLRARR